MVILRKVEDWESKELTFKKPFSLSERGWNAAIFHSRNCAIKSILWWIQVMCNFSRGWNSLLVRRVHQYNFVFQKLLQLILSQNNNVIIKKPHFTTSVKSINVTKCSYFTAHRMIKYRYSRAICLNLKSIKLW